MILLRMVSLTILRKIVNNTYFPTMMEIISADMFNIILGKTI
jgi:hypothetical protein